MSLQIQTIIDIILITLAYCASVLFVPNIVFHRMLRTKTLSQKFVICTIIGNVYLVNIIFVLFLLHIPGKITLYLFTIVPAFILWVLINRPRIQRFFNIIWLCFTRLLLGEAKIKTILGILTQRPKRRMAKAIRAFFSHIRRHFIEWISMIGLLAFDVWYYGYATVTKFIYGTSDLVVHQQWVNAMDDGVIFFNGIYPFGFHNVIYFLHTFFGFSVTSIFRAFNITQMLFIYVMMYLLLKRICRSRIVPIIGIYIFTLPDLFNYMEIARYQWTLPQEFGMIFLYPCAYFLIDFFKQKKEELDTEKKYKKDKKLYCLLAQYQTRPSTIHLIMFAFSFSLTLASHFYITIVAFILCFAIAIAYVPYILHYRYLVPIIITGILSIFLAVAPLGIAYAQGTPLQGSLNWALGMMSPGSTTTESDSDSDSDTTKDASKDTVDDSTQSTDKTKKKENVSKKTHDEPASFVGTLKKISQTVRHFSATITNKVKQVNRTAAYMFEGCYNIPQLIPWLIKGSELFAILAGIFILLSSIQRIGNIKFVHLVPNFYYRNLLSTAIYYIFLIFMLCGEYISLPTLMDYTRSRTFLAYGTPLFIVCAIDAVYVILFRPFCYRLWTELAPLALCISLICLTVTQNAVKPLNYIFSLQHPGEVQCNYQIMEDYPAFEYTIVTTTNSLEMIKSKARHYEISTFLKKMDHFSENTKVTIPTKYVFFYIEKQPVNYNYFDFATNPIQTQGYVSEEAAAKEASYTGMQVYWNENRYILESKLFYWAKAFEAKYPQEFQIYYEDDDFICYRILQNEYQLYNFALDYGFNK